MKAKKKAKNIIFIHGAGSSSTSFNYIKHGIGDENCYLDYTYNNDIPLLNIIEEFRQEIDKLDSPPIIIGHSLGGVIAASLAKITKVTKVITLATPFGGSFVASVFSWVIPSQLMIDLSQNSPILRKLRNDPPTIPILSFVTDSNNIIFGKSTDGVVTVESQLWLDGPEYRTVNLNHFEVLLSMDITKQIKEAIDEV